MSQPEAAVSFEDILFSYGEMNLSCRLVRRAEMLRSVRISVTPEGEIQAVADAGMTREEVVSALQQRARWILAARKRFEEQREHALPHEYVGGETHFYLGRRYQLQIVDESEGKNVKMRGSKLVVPSRYPWSEEPEVVAARSAEVKRRLAAWYRLRAEESLPRYFTPLLELVPWAKLQPPPLRLVTMKQRWGSCTPQGVILLNPKLVTASRRCIGYVIMHELCHLKEHSHSSYFWSLMTQVCPDWKASRAELDRMGEIWLGLEEGKCASE